jgi:hypothetical protein
VQFGEVHVHGRHPAARTGIVDDVVVHQCARVQQFQGGEQPQSVFVDGDIGYGAESPVGEGGA